MIPEMYAVFSEGGLGNLHDLSTQKKTRHGIDRFLLMLKFIEVIEGKSKTGFIRLKSFIVQQIKRGITRQEEEDLLNGILRYIRSEPSTTEREEAMKYLFGAEFMK